MPLVSRQTASFCECGNHAFLAMKRGVTLVDPVDAGLLCANGFSVAGGYAQSKKLGRLHRAIVGGDPEHVDHANHDTLDNRRHNLRKCTKQQNQFNKKPNARGKSRFKGVSWLSAAQRWIVRISLDRQKSWVGSFSDEEEAAHAYDVAAKRVFGEFAFLNFPEGGVPSLPL